MTRLSDLTLLEPDVIELYPEDLDEIQQTLDWATGESHQWSRYLQGLALAGFIQWIEVQGLNLPLQLEDCTLRQSQYANWLDAVCNLSLGDFNICLLVTESITQGSVSLPRAAVDMPKFSAHIYGLVEVEEELGTVIIRGLLRQDDWRRYRQSAEPTPFPDWTYSVPLSLFEPEPRRLGLYLKHLDPSAIASSAETAAQIKASTALSTTLDGTSLNSLEMEQPLWQQISWGEAASILASPEKLSQVNQGQSLRQTIFRPLQTVRHQPQHQPEQTATQEAAQVIINAAQWLNVGLDALTESLGFFSYSQLQLARGLRSALAIEDAINHLRSEGLPISSEINPVFTDIDLENIDLRICLLPYTCTPHSDELSTDEAPSGDWSLIIIISTQVSEYLPEGLKLSVTRGSEALDPYLLEFEDESMYDIVDARFGESLQISITAPGGTQHTLPMLTFTSEGK